MSEDRWISLLALVVLLGGGVVAFAAGSIGAARATLRERNAFCAKQGGRLVRGQGNDSTYICIDPRGIRWERP